VVTGTVGPTVWDRLPFSPSLPPFFSCRKGFLVHLLHRPFICLWCCTLPPPCLEFLYPSPKIPSINTHVLRSFLFSFPWDFCSYILGFPFFPPILENFSVVVEQPIQFLLLRGSLFRNHHFLFPFHFFWASEKYFHPEYSFFPGLTSVHALSLMPPLFYSHRSGYVR